MIVVMEMRGYDSWSPRVCGAPRPAWRVACGTPFEQQPGGCPASLFMRHVCVGLPSWAWWLGGTTWFQVAAARPPSTGQSALSLMVAPEPDFGSAVCNAKAILVTQLQKVIERRPMVSPDCS